jgi:hypothetical protein
VGCFFFKLIEISEDCLGVFMCPMQRCSRIMHKLVYCAATFLGAGGDGIVTAPLKWEAKGHLHEAGDM